MTTATEGFNGIIRIHVEDGHGSYQLNYDGSREQPLDETGYGDPPCDSLALHAALADVIAGTVRKEIEKQGIDKQET